MHIESSTATAGFNYKLKVDPDVHGKVYGFVPAGEYVLIRRMKSIEEVGGILKPEVAIEQAERGEVIATSSKAHEVPQGVIAKFSKYGAEDITFDDQGADRYCLVRYSDIRGWHHA